MARYWLPHPDHVWVKGVVVPEINRTGAKGSPGVDALKFRYDWEGATGHLSLPANRLETFHIVQPDEETGIDDVCCLSSVHEASLLNTVRVRYERDLIYTNVAKTLIAVNPFHPLPIYDASHVHRYASASQSELDQVPPHIFGISQLAITNLKGGDRNQAMLISGESGAGKTESAKLILSFVADVGSGSEVGIQERVLHTSQVLEAFGNAMTVRNNNSSRFGKWLDLQLSPSINILGCRLTSYLLETIRVCVQSPNERGFHVFFQMLQARGKVSKVTNLNLRDPGDYHYLNHGRQTAPGVNDAAEFERLVAAFEALEISEDLQEDVFRILGAVLELGNVDFGVEGESSKLADENSVLVAAQLLKADANELKQCMLKRKLVIGHDVTIVALRPEQSQAARDGLARLLYGRLFAWLIAHMNSKLSTKRVVEEGVKPPQDLLLGVLDIAGFESFEHNSLEQLMINLSNEHLQQQFNQIIFKEELDECEKEGIELPLHGDFVDNADCLTLIDGKAGILDLLDETMVVPKATDTTFTHKVIKDHESNIRIVPPKVKSLSFGVKHFAGTVTYFTEGWLEKNSDKPPEGTVTFLTESKSQILRSIGSTMAEEMSAGAAGPGAGRSKKTKSVTAVFRSSLRQLMDKISKATPHYIRCVKPNTEKVPHKFDSPMVMEQLILNGVLATVKIRQRGFAYRIPQKDFVYAYQCLIAELGNKPGVEMESDQPDAVAHAANAILSRLDEISASIGTVRKGSVIAGKSKVFVQLDTFQALENGRRMALLKYTLRLQCNYRGTMARKWVTPWLALHKALGQALADARVSEEEVGPAADRLRRCTSWCAEPLVDRMATPESMRRTIKLLDTLLAEAENLDMSNRRTTVAGKLKRRMQQEVEVLQDAEQLSDCVDVVDLEKAIAKARGLRILSLPRFVALEERLSSLRCQLPLVKAMQSALAAAAAGDVAQGAGAAALQDAADAVAGSGLAGHAEQWLKELNGADLYAQVCNCVEARKAQVAAEAEAEKRKQLAAEERAHTPTADEDLAEVAKETSGDTVRDVAIKLPAHGKCLMSGRRSIGMELTPKAHNKLSGSRLSTIDLRRIKQAIEEYDVDTLECMLREAVNSGLSETAFDAGSDGEYPLDETPEQILAAAGATFKKLQDADFLLEELEEAREEVSTPEPPLMWLKRLDNLSEQLQRLPGFESEAAEATLLTQTALVKRASLQRPSLAEEQLVPGVPIRWDWNRLAEFSRLKSATTWSGHRPSIYRPEPKKQPRRVARAGFDEAKAATSQPMLVHSKVCIAEALTKVPSGRDATEYEAAAVLNFRNLLISTCDRHAQECQRQASRFAVILLARSDEGLRDEVVIQLLKQMNGNPTPRSLQLCWELLHELCKHVIPCSELRGFIRLAAASTAEVNPGPAISAGNEAWAVIKAEVVKSARACLLAVDNPPKGDDDQLEALLSIGRGSPAPRSDSKESSAAKEHAEEVAAALLGRAAEAVEKLDQTARLVEDARQAQADREAAKQTAAEGTIAALSEKVAETLGNLEVARKLEDEARTQLRNREAEFSAKEAEFQMNHVARLQKEMECQAKDAEQRKLEGERLAREAERRLASEKVSASLAAKASGVLGGLDKAVKHVFDQVRRAENEAKKVEAGHSAAMLAKMDKLEAVMQLSMQQRSRQEARSQPRDTTGLVERATQAVQRLGNTAQQVEEERLAQRRGEVGRREAAQQALASISTKASVALGRLGLAADKVDAHTKSTQSQESGRDAAVLAKLDKLEALLQEGRAEASRAHEAAGAKKVEEDRQAPQQEASPAGLRESAASLSTRAAAALGRLDAAATQAGAHAAEIHGSDASRSAALFAKLDSLAEVRSRDDGTIANLMQGLSASLTRLDALAAGLEANQRPQQQTGFPNQSQERELTGLMDRLSRCVSEIEGKERVGQPRGGEALAQAEEAEPLQRSEAEQTPLADGSHQAPGKAGDQQELQKAEHFREHLQALQAERSALTLRLEEALNQLTDLHGEQQQFSEDRGGLRTQLDSVLERLGRLEAGFQAAHAESPELQRRASARSEPGGAEQRPGDAERMATLTERMSAALGRLGPACGASSPRQDAEAAVGALLDRVVATTAQLDQAAARAAADGPEAENHSPAGAAAPPPPPEAATTPAVAPRGDAATQTDEAPTGEITEEALLNSLELLDRAGHALVRLDSLAARLEDQDAAQLARDAATAETVHSSLDLLDRAESALVRLEEVAAKVEDLDEEDLGSQRKAAKAKSRAEAVARLMGRAETSVGRLDSVAAEVEQHIKASAERAVVSVSVPVRKSLAEAPTSSAPKEAAAQPGVAPSVPAGVDVHAMTERAARALGRLDALTERTEGSENGVHSHEVAQQCRAVQQWRGLAEAQLATTQRAEAREAARSLGVRATAALGKLDFMAARAKGLEDFEAPPKPQPGRSIDMLTLQATEVFCRLDNLAPTASDLQEPEKLLQRRGALFSLRAQAQVALEKLDALVNQQPSGGTALAAPEDRLQGAGAAEPRPADPRVAGVNARASQALARLSALAAQLENGRAAPPAGAAGAAQAPEATRKSYTTRARDACSFSDVLAAKAEEALQRPPLGHTLHLAVASPAAASSRKGTEDSLLSDGPPRASLAESVDGPTTGDELVTRLMERVSTQVARLDKTVAEVDVSLRAAADVGDRKMVDHMLVSLAEQAAGSLGRLSRVASSMSPDSPVHSKIAATMARIRLETCPADSVDSEVDRLRIIKDEQSMEIERLKAEVRRLSAAGAAA